MKSLPFHLICKEYYKKNNIFTPDLEHKKWELFEDKDTVMINIDSLIRNQKKQ